MKVESANREVMTNASNTQQLSIQANAKMFEILSSKIYTYKVAAIVREICSNAYDAHVASGMPEEPFRVVLPNSLHPYFEVEDFGIGLSDDDIRNVFTVYGESTKGSSNDFIGAMGLGCKTPFAYTTSFTIQARKDGTERLYSAFIGEAGAPSISLLRERSTGEGNGVKIKVPVKEVDFNSFRNECAFVLSFFRVRPYVVGAENVGFDYNFEESILDEIESDKVVVRETKDVKSALYSGNSFYAVMGGVCYPVKESDIFGNAQHGFYRVKRTPEEEYLHRIVFQNSVYKAVFLNFPIGSLDVSASREALSIEPGSKTEQTVKDRFIGAIRKLIEDDEKDLESCTHPMEAYRKIKDKYGDIVELVSGTFKYKDKPLAYHLDKAVDIFDAFDNDIFLKSRKNTSIFYKATTHKFDSIDFKNIKNGVTILYSQEPKIRGFIKHGRMLAGEAGYGNEKVVICIKEPIKDRVFKRIEQYLGVEVEWVKLEDEKEKHKVHTPAKAKTTPNTRKKTSTEITTKHTMIKKGVYQVNDLGPQTRIDTSDGIKTVYVDRFEPNYYRTNDDMFHLKYENHNGDSRFGFFRYRNLDQLSFFIDEDVRVILKNKVNRKSIEDNNIQYLGDFIKEICERKKQDMIEFCLVANHFHVNSSKDVMFRDNTMDIILNSESDICDDYLKGFRELARKWHNELGTAGLYGQFSRLDLEIIQTFISSDELGVFNGVYPEKMFRKINEEFRQLYPMIAHNIHSEIHDEIKTYIKQVDFYNANA